MKIEKYSLSSFFWKILGEKKFFVKEFDIICRKNYKNVEKNAIILYIKIMVRINKKGGKN